MGEDDTGKSKLEQQIMDRFVQYGTLSAQRLHSLGITMPPEWDPSEALYIKDQKKKAQEENPEVSEQGVEKMLEDRWRAMKPEEREAHKRQVRINHLKALNALGPPPPPTSSGEF